MTLVKSVERASRHYFYNEFCVVMSKKLTSAEKIYNPRDGVAMRLFVHDVVVRIAQHPGFGRGYFICHDVKCCFD